VKDVVPLRRIWSGVYNTMDLEEFVRSVVTTGLSHKMKERLNQASILSRINLDLFSRELNKNFECAIKFSENYETCCVCMVDIVNSTRIISSLPKTLACKYYFIFLNSMTLIAKEYGAIIVKNVGDCLLYYFPKFLSNSGNSQLEAPIECGLSMLEVHDKINKIMFRENLSPIDYRISADCGPVMKASILNSKTEDVFGTTVNICSKMNNMFKRNSMVIGHDLFQVIKGIDSYYCEFIGDYNFCRKLPYSIYSIARKSVDFRNKN